MKYKAPSALLAFALAVAFDWPVLAQTSWPSAGGGRVDGKVQMCQANGIAVPCPYPTLPMAGTGQHNLALSASTPLTVPAKATYASVCASSSGSTVGVRYTTDGTTPTSTVGQPLLAGQCVSLAGPAVLAAFKAIETGATATLDVEYFQ